MPRPRLYREPDQGDEQPMKAAPRVGPSPIGRTWFHVRDLIDDALDSVSGELADGRIELEVDVPSTHRVLADRHMLLHCVKTLVHSALQAMPGGGQLVITSHVGSRGFELEIADSRADRCDTASAATQDFANMRRLTAALGGDLDARNCPEGGAAFTICIPHRALEAAA